MYMIDDGENDEKLICVADDDKHYEHAQTVEDLGGHVKHKVEHYFAHYKDLQKKEVKITGWGDKAEAYALIERYQKQASK